MACNCISKMEQKIKTEISKRNDDFKNKVVTTCEIDNQMHFFDGTGTRLYSLVELMLEYKNKKGETKCKRQMVNLSYSYCPFCGKKYDENKQEG